VNPDNDDIEDCGGCVGLAAFFGAFFLPFVYPDFVTFGSGCPWSLCLLLAGFSFLVGWVK